MVSHQIFSSFCLGPLWLRPYRDYYLTMSALVVDGVDVSDQIGDDYTVSYIIDYETYSGSPTTVFVESVGVLNATVLVSYQGTQISETVTPIAVKYMRREIRSLTDADRSKWVSSMKVLYEVSTEEGQATYGPNYYSAEWFSAQHLNGAGRNDCDHWHDGAAIAVYSFEFYVGCGTLVAVHRSSQFQCPIGSMVRCVTNFHPY